MSLPLVVGITGASGVIYGVELLKVLQTIDIETHLIMSSSAGRNLAIETNYSVEEVHSFADVVHSNKNLGAAVASGSFLTQGMIVVPCTIKSLSGIAYSYSDNLITRAADVTIKEKRPLIMMIRETPLHKGHLEMMVRCADLGATILPPMPSFYHDPKNIQDIINHSIGKVLDQFGIEHDLFQRWDGGAGRTT